MHWRSTIVALTCVLFQAACARQPNRSVESLAGGQDVSQFALTMLKGTRNGDRLDVQAVFSANSRSLAVDLHFLVTPPTHLESGTWNGEGTSGAVRERSTTFLGGQSGPPSIGGRWDLLAPDGQPLYRIAIPLQELTNKL